MKKRLLLLMMAGIASLWLNACAGDDYSNDSYYDNRSYNDKQVDKVINEEINSLSDADIAQLNTLK